jgi:hypothetical protein
MGSASKRMCESSLSRTSLRRLVACPKRERIRGWQDRSVQHAFPTIPVKSTALPLRKTDIRNGVITRSLSAGTPAEQGSARM